MTQKKAKDEEPNAEELLVEGLRCRVPAAIECFYNEYYQTFLRVMIRLTGDFPTAQDLAHDAVLRVIDRAETYKSGPGRTPRVWFMTVLRSTFLDSCRRRKVRRTDSLTGGSDDGDFELPATQPTVQELAELGERVGAVQAALLLLDAEQRLLITLRVYEELSLPEVVEVMRAETEGQVTTYGQVSGRLHQAKLRLRELLEKHWPDLFP